MQLQDQENKLTEQIKDIVSDIKPLEFESYYDYFIIHSFKKGVSESGKVDIDDLRSREHGRYYKRIKRSDVNSNSNSVPPTSNNDDNDLDYINTRIKIDPNDNKSDESGPNRRRTRSQASSAPIVNMKETDDDSDNEDLESLDLSNDERSNSNGNTSSGELSKINSDFEDEENRNVATTDIISVELDTLPSSPDTSDDVEDNIDKDTDEENKELPKIEEETEKNLEEKENGNDTNGTHIESPLGDSAEEKAVGEHIEKEKEQEQEEEHELDIHDLYESLVPKVKDPERRSDWILPPRFRYIPEKQMRTKHVHETVKVNELVSMKRIRKVLSRFEGGVAGVRKRDWESDEE